MLASLSLMAMLMFSTIALAQEEEGGQPAAPGASGKVNTVDEPATASAFAATATATATASPTATGTATASPTATATAAASALPKSGGPLPVVTLTLMASLVLIGSGVAALVLLRRSLRVGE